MIFTVPSKVFKVYKGSGVIRDKGLKYLVFMLADFLIGGKSEEVTCRIVNKIVSNISLCVLEY